MPSTADKFSISDSRFLLRFLRAKKFSVVQAQRALERYLLLRQTFGVAFCCLDITIPQMQELTDIGYLFACPKRDSQGRRVVVARPGDYLVNTCYHFIITILLICSLSLLPHLLVPSSKLY